MSFVRPLIVMIFSSSQNCFPKSSIFCKAAMAPRADLGGDLDASFCVGLVEQVRKTLQRQCVPLGSESRDYAVGAKGYVRVVAEFLALVDVRYVDFDDRPLKGI